ncbi:protein kinase domain-containing protein [Kitasatospora cinereorecta]|uniref:non-specific serine/threonine protein kinase n=1 Tax=Kitasatospora cinereorecta TaxID=285560 RepID=A0ABW0VMN7_9ACTN
MTEPLLPGDPRQLGRFYLDGRLGSGGQGVVYEGYGADGRRVAVKVLRAVDGPDRERLRREIQAWSKVEPYCTTKVLEADLDAATPYVVSEFVDGTDLRRAVNAGGPYGPEELRRLAVGLAAALVAIHRAGVVHRDFKPENILLGPDGPRVIDFGIARIMEGTATTGVPMGTLRYMPPERYRGEPGDGKVDVWGWAAVVLFAATGRDAFEGTSVGAIADQVATHQPDTSGLPQPLDALVRAALGKSPDARPGAEELLLSLVGRADLAGVVERVTRAAVPEDAVPSRAEAAEVTFAGLDPKEQKAVPSILLRLVAAGERAEDTLRAARPEEFHDGRLTDGVVEKVIAALTEAGVLDWEDGTVTLASAALIRSWPRLRDWVQEEREGLAVHQRLTEASRIWADHGRRRGDLLQGTPLEQARDWAATGRRNLVLSRTEREFLEGGSALGRRRGRLRVALSAVLALLLIAAVSGAGVAYDQWHTVLGQKLTLADQQHELTRQLGRLTSAKVAAGAQALRVSDPELARRLAVAAESLGDTPEAWSTLLELRSQWEAAAFRLPTVPVTAPTKSGIAPAAIDGSGRTLLRATGASVEVWDLRTRKQTGTWTAPGNVLRVAVSGDGGRAAILGEDDTVLMLDLAHLAPVAGTSAFRVPIPDGIGARIALSPHGNYLAVSGDAMSLWDTRAGKAVFRTGSLSSVSSFFSPWEGASFSPDEKTASFFTPQGAAPFTWVSLPEGKPLPAPGLGVKPADVRSATAFSPDGQWVAVATGQSTVVLADRSKPLNHFTLVDAPVNTVAGSHSYPLTFSQDGRFLNLGSTVWKTPTASFRDPAQPVLTYSSTASECSPETPYRFTGDSSQLVCLGGDGTVRVLGVGAITAPPAASEKWSTYGKSVISQDRTTVALVKQVVDATSLASDVTEVRAVASPDRRRTFAIQPQRIQLSPDGRTLAAWQGGGIHLYDAGAPDSPQQGELPNYDSTWYAAAFSPDGRFMAVEGVVVAGPGPGYATTLDYWDLRTMRKIHTLTGEVTTSMPDPGVFFAPDGQSVTAAPYFGRVSFPAGNVLVPSPSDLQADEYSSDGTSLFAYPTATQPYLKTWNARTLKPQGESLRVGTVSPADPNHRSAAASAVSPDATLYAVAQESGSVVQVKLWDLTRQSLVGVAINGIVNQVVALSFSPDGSRLTAIDEYGATYTVPIGKAATAQAMCAEVGPLSREQWAEYIPGLPYQPTCGPRR